MDAFYQGIISGITMVGGMCAFNYWMFNMMEKRIDHKLDMMTADIHTLVSDMDEGRRRTDKLYEMFIELFKLNNSNSALKTKKMAEK